MIITILRWLKVTCCTSYELQVAGSIHFKGQFMQVSQIFATMCRESSVIASPECPSSVNRKDSSVVFQSIQTIYFHNTNALLQNTKNTYEETLSNCAVNFIRLFHPKKCKTRKHKTAAAATFQPSCVMAKL